jgi:hypothetical protein
MLGRSALAALALLATPFAVACSSGSDSHAAPKDGGALPSDAAEEPTDPGQLPAPPSGQGLQMKTDAFGVAPGTEVQNCYFFRVADLAQSAGFPAGQPINVHRVQIVQKVGSHHMNIFRVRTIKGLDPANGQVQTATNGMGPCFVSSNWADWPLVANTQRAGDQDWTYPDGVANSLNGDPAFPDEWLMLQTHFVNASTQKTQDGTGQVAVNLWTLPSDQVTAHIGTLFATDQNIRICQSNPTPKYMQGCQFNSTTPVTIIGANGHFHSRGTEFDIYAWDGTSTTPPDSSNRFYQSLAWDDPPMLHDLAVNVPPNSGIQFTCNYQWQAPSSGCGVLNAFDQAKHMTPASQQDCCYTFGPQVDVNEHCNAFVYYYPAQGNVICQ